MRRGAVGSGDPDAVPGHHARLETRFPVVTGLVDRMVSVNIFDSATRVAAQCFLTAVPLLFVVGAYAPTAVRDQVSASISAVFGLTGQAKDEVKQAFQPRPTICARRPAW